MLRDARFPPQSYARIGGVLYLLIITAMLFPPILVPAFIGELSFAVWLTVKGVNLARWRGMTDRSGSALS